MRIRVATAAALLTVGALAGCSDSDNAEVPAAVTNEDKPCVERYIALFDAIELDDAKRNEVPTAFTSAGNKLTKDCPLEDLSKEDRQRLLDATDPALFDAVDRSDKN